MFNSLLYSSLLYSGRRYSSVLAQYAAMASKVREQLAKRLRELRAERGWSQDELAAVSGLHRAWIGAIERSERNMGIDNLEKLAKAFKVQVADLFKE